MATTKRSISFDPEVLLEAEQLAREAGKSFSGFVNDALMNRVRLARLRAIVEADEREFGPVPDEVSAAIEAEWPD